jgi:RHS repeat-associated protein
VTTLGTGVDAAVRRLTAAYEVRGMTTGLTSYDNATVGSGSIVNDVALAYNSFGQIISDTQSHSGAVVPGTTPQVLYAYTNGSTNMIRPTTLTYPNARAITIGYGTTGGINDSASRVDSLIDGATTLVTYSYLGSRRAVQTTYPEPSLQHTLLGSSGGNSPAGDIYWGLDLFGRIVDSRWFNTGTSADVDRIKYGYDRASNRIWRQNPVATAAGANFDEYYSNDGLQRLKDMKRGTLNGSNTGITSPTFEQCWTLDPTGNWRGFNEAASGTAWTLNQTRAANTVNEITGITNTTGSAWANPAYDPAGNMTTMPQPGAPGSSYTATYDAWNRLVILKDGASNVQQNQYDARNFRTVILTYTAGVLSETRHSYFTSGWRCIEERVGTATTADRQFIWGTRYIDDLVLRDRGSERLYAMQDANFNVTSVANTSAAVQERYVYSAYGVPRYLTNSFAARSVSSFGWETLYSGYRLDVPLQLYVVRHRIFHPLTGTWCSVDPIGYRGGTMNLYHYVLSSPLSLRDGLGLQVPQSPIPLHLSPQDELAELMYESFPLLAPPSYNPNQLALTPSGVYPSSPPTDLSVSFVEDSITTVAWGYVALGTQNGEAVAISGGVEAPVNWNDAIAAVNRLPLPPYNSLTITGHGNPRSAASFTQATLQDPNGPASQFLTALGRHLSADATVDLRTCQSARNRALLQMIADRTRRKTQGYTGNYSIWPYGEQFTFYPGGNPAPRQTNYYPTTDSPFGMRYGGGDRIFYSQDNTLPYPAQPSWPKSHVPCFSEHSCVWTQGGMTSIRSIKPGDFIVGYDITARVSGLTKVLDVIVHDGEDFWLNELNVGGSDVIALTDGHPMFDGERWLLSHELDGRTVLSLHEDHATRLLCSLRRCSRIESRVYNLITECGTYLVGKPKLVASGVIDVTCQRAAGRQQHIAVICDEIGGSTDDGVA